MRFARHAELLLLFYIHCLILCSQTKWLHDKIEALRYISTEETILVNSIAVIS